MEYFSESSGVERWWRCWLMDWEKQDTCVRLRTPCIQMAPSGLVSFLTTLLNLIKLLPTLSFLILFQSDFLTKLSSRFLPRRLLTTCDRLSERIPTRLRGLHRAALLERRRGDLLQTRSSQAGPSEGLHHSIRLLKGPPTPFLFLCLCHDCEIGHTEKF